jgi:dipeptidyl aminopeptidase/acylaminoacyl peptidase
VSVHAGLVAFAVWMAGISTAVAQAQTSDLDAEQFGALPWTEIAELSPDAKHIAFIAPTAGGGAAAVVENLSDGSTRTVLTSDGKPFLLRYCGWPANDRIVCRLTGTAWVPGIVRPLSYARTIAANIDGTKALALSKQNFDGVRLSMNDGRIIDWLSGEDGMVLMERDTVKQRNLDSNIKRDADGLGVERVDTRTGRGTTVEKPSNTADSYIADGNGVIRIVSRDTHRLDAVQNEMVEYRYRLAGSRDWLPFSRVNSDGPGLRPIAVDGTSNVAYALDKRDGRDALFRVLLDGSLKTELVYADPVVDVDGVVTIGRHGRVIGVTYLSDRRQVIYFDQEYKALADGLAKALPKAPMVHFASASADERKLLIFASGDTDPGRYYLLDRNTRGMTEVVRARPQLEGRTLGDVKAISFRASDGATIPAYLTLPVGSAGKALPAIVMPHGGPSSRDEWGFDWLSQFFVARGFAVLQPQYRGSSGYGTTFLNGNGFRSWRLATNDILDAGRWLAQQGIADPRQLAIVGWSYGGYAALQANVIDPTVFKAAVAIAPVTDFDMLREQYRIYNNFSIISQYIGTGPEADAGSPLRHAAAISSPVLMFHGDRDLNVDVSHSRAMQAALGRAGKPSDLVIYPGLDHQLPDRSARADMLKKADAFLKASLQMKT